MRSPDYRLFRKEGLLFSPLLPQPPGTVPLHSWYSPSRNDNFVTSHPAWRGSRGDTRSPDYRFVRLEGYAYDPARPQPKGTRILHGWWDGDRQDNFATTDFGWAGFPGGPERSPKYRYVRREGYVLPLYTASGNVPSLTIPLHIRLLHSTTDGATGLPGYSEPVRNDAGELTNRVSTIRHYDAAIDALNAALDAARGHDTRRLQFVRSSLDYFTLPPTNVAEMRQLYMWWSPSRLDNYTAGNPSWDYTQVGMDERSPDYQPATAIGALFSPDRPRPPGTIPVYHWYHPEEGDATRADNLITSDSRWAGSSGSVRRGYRFVEVIGYIHDPARPQPPNTAPLSRWYNDARNDTMVRADHGWTGERGDTRDGYRFIRREGYVELPAQCLSGSTLANVDFKAGAINIIATNACNGKAIEPAVVRASTSSLAHEVGHALGLYHMFQGNGNLATVERLHRTIDITHDESCYKLGDRFCDTPPDYGFVNADGSGIAQCDGRAGVPIACQQEGPRCDPLEPMIDGAGLCRNAGDQGVRTYNAAVLGLQLGTPNNIMAYHNQDEFSYEQFLAMMNFALWRAGRQNEVPEDEKRVFRDFITGPPADQMWSATPAAFRQLEPAVVIEHSMGRLSGGDWLTSIPSSAGNAILSFRAEISGRGAMGPVMSVTVTTPDGTAISFAHDQLHQDGNAVLIDEMFGKDLSSAEGRRAFGRWRLHISDPAGFSAESIRLTVISAAR